jgi:hypothetical protein
MELTETESRLIGAMKSPRFLVGLFVGIVIGGLVSWKFFPGDKFNVEILNQAHALKINKRTGEAWMTKVNRDTRDYYWYPVKEVK